jgi:hypothetical protein
MKVHPTDGKLHMEGRCDLLRIHSTPPSTTAMSYARESQWKDLDEHSNRLCKSTEVMDTNWQAKGVDRYADS